MFALIESSPALRQDGAWVPRLASFAAHAALVAAAVLATRQVITAAPPALVNQHLIWDAPTAPDLPASPTASATSPAPNWTLMPTPSVNIAPDIPPPGPGEILPGAAGDPLPALVVGVPGGLSVAGHAPLDARYVEEQPVMLAHPPVNYPEVLRQAGIEGRVLVEAVLDTLGRAEAASLRVTNSPNPLFDREALAVVALSRYRPGRVDGHAVRVRIQVPITFSISR